MSLQVWLPLNGDLRNQGLYSTAAATNHNANVSTAGKVGQCYEFTGTDSYITISPEAMVNFTNECSVTFWLKINEWNTSYCTIFQAGTGTRAWAGYVFGCLRDSSTSTLNFTVGNASSTTTNIMKTPALDLNTWYHIGYIYRGGKCYIYINGKLRENDAMAERIFTPSVAPDFSKITRITLGKASDYAGYQSHCSLNDVRIYNHGLSNKEVKELAKGLAIHYKLDGTGYANQNLLLNTLKDNGKTHTTYDIADYNFSESLVSGQAYTITAKINTSSEKTYVGFYHSGGSTSMSGWVPVTADGLYTKTFTADSTMAGYTTGAGHGFCRVYISNNPSGTQGSYALAGSANVVWIKIEKGNKPTIPWCFNKSEISQIVLDNSGFNNNGVVSGNLEQSTESPIYLSSVHFNGSTQVRASKEITTTIDSTICLWVKASLSSNCHILDARASDSAGKQPIYSYTNGSIQTGGYGAYVTSKTGLLEANKWVHLAIVQSGNSILLYKNGVLFQTLSATNASLIKPIIGGRWSGGTNYTGYLSDFRVYTTALTQEDIQQIVNTGVQIDDSYNLFAREVNEQ